MCNERDKKRNQTSKGKREETDGARKRESINHGTLAIRKLERRWYDQTVMTRTNLVDTMLLGNGKVLGISR